MTNLAFLKPECPFYDLFLNGLCPIINIMVPSHVELIGCSETEVYMVALDRLNEYQLSEIARRLALAAGADPAIVLADIKRERLPLRVSQCSGCSTDVPFFL